MWSYFVFKNITYNIRKGPLLRLPAAKSTSYGINSVLFRAYLLWNSLLQSIKYSESIVECGCMNLFRYQCGMLMAVYGCQIDITLVSASTG